MASFLSLLLLLDHPPSLFHLHTGFKLWLRTTSLTTSSCHVHEPSSDHTLHSLKTLGSDSQSFSPALFSAKYFVSSTFREMNLPLFWLLSFLTPSSHILWSSTHFICSLPTIIPYTLSFPIIETLHDLNSSYPLSYHLLSFYLFSPNIPPLLKPFHPQESKIHWFYHIFYCPLPLPCPHFPPNQA